MIEVSAIPAFRDNYIWVIGNGGGRVVVVDPGDAEPVTDYLTQRGLELDGILVTHHHHDHVGGVAELARGRDIPVWGPTRERIPARTDGVSDGDRVTLESLDGITLSVMEVPGHTAGHVAYVGDGMLFCGDTLFAGGCGRLFEGTPAQMRASLARLRELPDETRVYCAHEYTQANLAFALAVEPDNAALQERYQRVCQQRADGAITLPSEMATERQTNPFLRWDQDAVHDGLARHGETPRDPDEVFAAVRAWKDSF